MADGSAFDGLASTSDLRQAAVRCLVRETRIVARAGVFIIEGSPEAKFPEVGSPPVIAGPELICVAGRVAADAPTELRVGPVDDHDDWIAAYDGSLATPELIVRILNGDDLHPDEDPLLAIVQVLSRSTRVQIFLSDSVEPDRILLVLDDL